MKRKSLVVSVVMAVSFALSIATVLAQELSDAKSTKEAKSLYKNLFALQGKKVIFGQQDALAYGVGWRYVAGQSDVKLVVNDNPGVYGWDLGGIELGDKKNLDSVPFKLMKEYIVDGYERGAAITISWHLRNPLTGGNCLGYNTRYRWFHITRWS